MRIAIGEFAHETNTFCPGLTEVEDFRRRHWEAGAEILVNHRGVRDELGGMVEAGERLGIEIVPTFATSTEPSATISGRAYETIRDELFTAIRAAGPVDAICLSLHGAGSAEGIDDVEGTILGELREIVGRGLPIVVTLDLHGNTTPEWSSTRTRCSTATSTRTSMGWSGGRKRSRWRRRSCTVRRTP